jgi:hypothetical protein
MEHQTKINNYCHNIGYEPYTIKWLKILCSSLEDVKNFTTNFDTGRKDREIFDVFNFRMHKLKSRYYSYKHFRSDIEKDVQSALENLCLCPVSSHDTELFIENVMNNKFTLYEFYSLQEQKPKFNFIKLLNWISA